ncbi:unnamed protein product [Caenorhabditis sp. 36 PRJEB53466]|nr:unnamed protein product [Caenorhabditis sp. 36 PRJEB53466]
MSRLCRVCHDVAGGTHFGVLSCSACSAFFRRTVAKCQKYKCLHKNACEILSTIRSMCRSCRFAKCLAVGMKKNAVQKYRDVYGKREVREKEKEKDAQIPSTSTSTAPRFPILDGIVRNYVHLEKVRQVIHRDETKSVFVQRDPRPLNYKETIKVFLKEYHLIEDWITNSFSDFASFPEDQKNVLLRNFYIQYIILECGYFSCKQGRVDITFLPSGDYIDCVNPETYYCDPDGEQSMSAEEAAKMFASSFENYRRNVYSPLLRDQIDRFEFLALAALTLFDTGLEGQSDECIEKCRKVRESLQRELLQYYEVIKKDGDSTIRLGNTLSMLPNLQRAARRMQEDMTLSNVFKAYSVDQQFYNLGKF